MRPRPHTVGNMGILGLRKDAAARRCTPIAWADRQSSRCTTDSEACCVQQPDPADLASSGAHGDRPRGQQVCYASIGRAWEHTTVTKSWQKQSDGVLGLAG